MTPRLSTDYPAEVTTVSFSALLEIFSILGKYRGGLTLVGGWAPFLCLREHQQEGDEFVHVGSIDADLAVAPSKVDATTYATIVESLEGRGYKHRLDKLGKAIPASYVRSFKRDTQEIPIQVDFLTSDALGKPTKRHHVVQGDLYAHRAHGCDAAFTHFEEVEIKGTLPEGGERSMEVRVADLVAILAMKGITLGERYKEKDAYDLYSVVAHVEGGPEAAAKKVAPYVNEKSVAEGLAQIRKDFVSASSNGPTWAAQFIAPEDKGAQAVERERAHLTVKEFFDQLGAKT